MIYLDGQHLTLNDFIAVARHKADVGLTEDAREAVLKARKMVEKIVADHAVVYGISTGFGKLSDVFIAQDRLSDLQRNLLVSHACGVGDVFHEDIVRGMLLLSVNALAKGVSGIRLETLDLLVAMLNKNVIPVVFSQGSLGASGDLAPLAHMSLPLIGLGEVFVEGVRLSAVEGFIRAGLTPLKSLAAKEGLSLINGTEAMTSVGALSIYDALRLSYVADLAAAMTMEALNGIGDVFDDYIHLARGHKGQLETARTMRALLDGSMNISTQGQLRMQDAYSLRCVPQVHGASKDALHYIYDKVTIELNAATDNPLLFVDEFKAISAGNFHGQPIAIPMDVLGIALSEMANIAERRLERLINPALSNGLPPFLTLKPGINSGFMIVQYVAASLVSENKILAHPASVDSIPSSANQEDHVSMGLIAARKAKTILDHTQKVIAMELLTACQALDINGKGLLSPHTKKAYEHIREHVPFLAEDQLIYPHIHTLEAMVKSHSLYELVFGEGYHGFNEKI